ncbi:MAG: hypothetical protein HDT26_14045 [Subdoligranulum sp.]|nr:hypothetical protein [Subdoligranulum sp.]
MTKREFRHDVERGLGSCVLALGDEAARERFLPLVLWACGRDTAYDAQSEGNRGRYLYFLIEQYPDPAPFLDVIETRLLCSIRSRGWEFAQDCDLLAYLFSGGVPRAWKILMRCYDRLYSILRQKRRRGKYGLCPERDNFEHLCRTLVCKCFSGKAQKRKIYRRIVQDLGILFAENPLFSFWSFEWFQKESEETLGKSAVQKILCEPDAGIATYARAMEQRQKERTETRPEPGSIHPQNAEEIYAALQAGQYGYSFLWAGRLWQRNRQDEIAKLAEFYCAETDLRTRRELLRILQLRVCAGMLQLDALLADSRSGDEDLSWFAFNALCCQKSERVRAYAYELLQSGAHIAQAVSLLAVNYTDADRTALIDAVRRVPIDREDTGWHSAFWRVMDLFREHRAHGLNELLPYLYRSTLCSGCRAKVVKEMGRRRMLTPALLAELQFDCNKDIRAYAAKRLRAAERHTAGRCIAEKKRCP